MADTFCKKCNAKIIDSKTGRIAGCIHYPVEDLTELSGKQMSDSIDLASADIIAVRLIEESMAILDRREM